MSMYISHIHDTDQVLGDLPESARCASLALSLLPLIFSYKSEKSLCGTVVHTGVATELDHPCLPGEYNATLVCTQNLYVYLCAHRMYVGRSRYVFERWQRLMRQLTRATPTSVGDAVTSVGAAAAVSGGAASSVCDEAAVRLPSDLIFEDQLGARHASLLHRCVSLS